MSSFEKNLSLLAKSSVAISVIGLSLLFVRVMLNGPTYKMGIGYATSDIKRLEEQFEKRK